LVVKADEMFRLLVLPADRKLDSAAVKRHFAVKKLRFADAAELLAVTGLVPGSVPPFGPPVLELPLFADPALLDNEKMAFNAGSLTDSIVMGSADYRRVAGAEWMTLAAQRS
jgi:Ala-tRNA(Pro) deacylase